MHLDRTLIVIRPRDFTDILDLSMRVVRAFVRPLFAAWLLGAVPAMALNGFLLSGWVEKEVSPDWVARYLFVMTFLVVWEMPLATSLITLYLGEVTFGNRPTVRQVFAAFRRLLPQMVWYQVFLRGLLTLPWVSWLVLYVSWPYLTEVILLERNPISSTRKNAITTWRRSTSLHRGRSGTLFARWFGAICMGGLLVAAFWLSVWFFRWQLFDLPEWSPVMFTVFLPLTVWLVVGFFAVVRFLSYLDLRIRNEGWDIELMLRAEGNRIAEMLE